MKIDEVRKALEQQPRLIPGGELVRILNYSLPTVRRLAETYSIRVYRTRPNGHRRYVREDVLAILPQLRDHGHALR